MSLESEVRIISFKSVVFNLFPFLNRGTQSLEVRCDIDIETKLFYKFLAIETAINLISNTLSLIEFKTFEKGKEVRKENYYLFNVEPNVNQNANRFWRQVYHNLVYENEALVIMQDGNLYVVDDFKKNEYAFIENYYENLVIGDYKLKDKFNESDVFYFALHSTKMVDLIDGIYRDYGELVEYSKNNYKRSNAKRGVLEIPTNYPQTPVAEEKLRDLLQNKFKDFYHAENGAVLPLTNGMKYTDLSNQTYKNSSDSRDIKNLIDDIFDYVAIAFQIPPQMLKGSIAESDKTWNNYMTHCIKPLSELIEDEINRKYYTKSDYLSKTYLKVDTNNVKYTDLRELAQALDLLTRNGINTINDNQKILGREELLGEEGNVRFMSLNLKPLNQVMEDGGEGENNGKEEN